MLKIKNITKDNRVLRDRHGANHILKPNQELELNIIMESNEIFRVIEEKIKIKKEVNE